MSLPALNWEALDWSILDRLRQAFLHGEAATGPYWRDSNDLAHYDFTYAERIGWKWDHVLYLLQTRGWTPPKGPLLDWGCGSGVAHRRVMSAWPDCTTTLQLYDHSLLAENYSRSRAEATHPDLPASSWDRRIAPAILVISHVLNELSEDDRTELREALAAATTVIWVEPGTSVVASDLVHWREQLREDFSLVYPCPHQRACGLLNTTQDWCHHFAPPPGEVGADANWVKFGQRAGIDLRSLPYSALVLDRRPVTTAAPQYPATLGRIIGRPRVAKPYARFLGCDTTGVSMRELPKKTAPPLVKKLDRPSSPRLLDWIDQDGKLTTATPNPAEHVEG